MARSTSFFYDWNVDSNGFIFAGNVFQGTQRPYIRSDKSDDEIVNDVDEGDYDIVFDNFAFQENAYVKTPNVYLHSNVVTKDTSSPDYAFLSYKSDRFNYFVYPGELSMSSPMYSLKIHTDHWLSTSMKKKSGDIFFYDVGLRQIVGKNETSGICPFQYCSAKNLKYSETDGWYFLYDGVIYKLYSLSWNAYLEANNAGPLSTWDEYGTLQTFIPTEGTEKYNSVNTYYGKTNLLNLTDELWPTVVQQHDNEIVAIAANVTVVDRINMFTTDATGKVTSVTYYKSQLNIGSIPVWVQNMRRLYPKVDGRNIDEILDNSLADETKAWMTPEEYYNKQTTTTKGIKSGEDGYTIAKVKTKDTEEKKTIPVWFWVNTLANWCTFKHGERHCTKLCVWNGRNGWDELDDIIKPLAKTQTIMQTYFYDITRFIRGTIISARTYYNKSKYQYKCIKLPYDSKFSQYDENNFQCIKIGRVHLNDKGTQRYPFTTGIPPVMRLPSGELALIYNLILPGMTKKHEVIYNDHMDFINSVCQAYFGKGDDKTIKEDWKRFYKLKDVLEEKATDVVTDDVSTLINAEEINTIREDNVLQNVTLNIPRQYPETLDATPDSFVEDWRQ